MFMRGWDDCLIGKRKQDNPYAREDFRHAWERGFDRCFSNEPLPAWFEAWRSE